MGNKVQFNLHNVHYSKIATSEDGELVFAEPKPIPGAVSFTCDKEGAEVKFVADGVLYYVSYTDTGYKGTLTVALIPDEFRKDILNDVEDETDHVLVEYATRQTNPFALLYEIDGDQKATRRVMYYCTVSRPGESADGQNPRTPQTEAMSLSASPLADGRTRARTLPNTVDDVFNNWFKSVWHPKASGTGASMAAEAAQARSGASYEGNSMPVPEGSSDSTKMAADGGPVSEIKLDAPAGAGGPEGQDGAEKDDRGAGED